MFAIKKSVVLFRVLQPIQFFKASPFTTTPLQLNNLPQSGQSSNPNVLYEVKVTDKIAFSRRCHVHILLVAILFAQVIHKLKQSGLKSTKSWVTMDQICGCLGLAELIVCTLAMQVLQKKRFEIVDFINALLPVGRQKALLEEGNRSVVETLAVWFIPFLMASILVFPLTFVLGFHWNDPCKCSLIGYFLLPKCIPMSEFPAVRLRGLPEWSTLLMSATLEIIVVSVNLWTWYVGFHAALFAFTILFVLTMGMLNDVVSRFRDRLRESKTNKKETQNAMKYREIIILATQSNLAQTDLLMICLGGGIGVLSFSLPALIKSIYLNSDVIILATLSMCAGNTILFLLVLLGLMRAIYKNSDESVRMLEHWSKRSGTIPNRNMERKWKKLFCRSCGTVKVKLGYCNFVEKLTPLVCLDYAIDSSVQILLLWN